MEEFSFMVDDPDMVKPQPISPQVIGREFIRQYFTRLHHMPGDMHNFYVKEAQFVHDVIDWTSQPATIMANGKREIVAALRSGALNYRNCLTRIISMDTLETLSGGIVVQVDGEISNDGGPMRPFSQTVVLSPILPFKYAVLNNIFRYRDVVKTDEVNFLDDGLSFLNDVQLDGQAKIGSGARGAIGGVAASAPSTSKQSTKVIKVLTRGMTIVDELMPTVSAMLPSMLMQPSMPVLPPPPVLATVGPQINTGTSNVVIDLTVDKESTNDDIIDLSMDSNFTDDNDSDIMIEAVVEVKSAAVTDVVAKVTADESTAVETAADVSVDISVGETNISDSSITSPTGKVKTWADQLKDASTDTEAPDNDVPLDLRKSTIDMKVKSRRSSYVDTFVRRRSPIPLANRGKSNNFDHIKCNHSDAKYNFFLLQNPCTNIKCSSVGLTTKPPNRRFTRCSDSTVALFVWRCTPMPARVG